MGLVSVLLISFCVLSISMIGTDNIVVGIPTTLDGPFKPVTVPLDKTFRGHAVDLPDTDPRVQRVVQGFEPEQISVSLSTTHDSVWISWITGTFFSHHFIGLVLVLSISLSFRLFYFFFGFV